MNQCSFTWILFGLLFLSACVPPTEEILTDVSLDYKNDKLLQRLYEFQDRQATDSLIPFLIHQDPSYRYAASMAFASIRDEGALQALYEILEDEVEEVRIAAAFAIGQIGSETAEPHLIAAYNSEDSTLQDQSFNAAILEAVGKCGTDTYLKALSTIKTFTRSDTTLLEGQAWGIYRYALRGKVRPEGTQRMIDLLTKKGYPGSVRFIASNYLSRAKNIQLDSFAQPLAESLFKERDPRIRMALAIALGKSQSTTALDTLKLWYQQERDYRVKANIIRALGNFDYRDIQPLVLEALNDSNLHVAVTSAQFLIDHGNARDATFYWRKAKEPLNWQVSTKLYGAAHKHLPSNYAEFKESINAELFRLFRESTNSYVKAGVIRTMVEYPWNYRNVYQLGFNSDDPVVRSASVNALKTIAAREDFDVRFRNSAPRIRQDILNYFIEAINKSDIAMVSIAASALRIPHLNIRQELESIDFLQRAMQRLTMPKELSTYNELNKTINYYNTGSEGADTKPEHNWPIVWRRLDGISENTRARIETTKGGFELAFLPELAPATVINFIQLCKEDYFDRKFFHRVVPNFVIQTGSSRGDGYGGLDHTIRSELHPIHYDREGYVGMASIGNHTESTQWFVTHSPTPHLDGNYTIFARVVEGMEVVHKIQQGDLITDVTIEN